MLLHYVIVLPGEKQNGMHFPQYVSDQNLALLLLPSFFLAINWHAINTAAADSHNLPASPCFHIRFSVCQKFFLAFTDFSWVCCRIDSDGGMGNTNFSFLLNILPFAARWLGVCVYICAATVHLMTFEWREMLIV